MDAKRPKPRDYKKREDKTVSEPVKKEINSVIMKYDLNFRNKVRKTVDQRFFFKDLDAIQKAIVKAKIEAVLEQARLLDEKQAAQAEVDRLYRRIDDLKGGIEKIDKQLKIKQEAAGEII